MEKFRPDYRFHDPNAPSARTAAALLSLFAEANARRALAEIEKHLDPGRSDAQPSVDRRSV